jgi:hypothetical protein
VPLDVVCALRDRLFRANDMAEHTRDTELIRLLGRGSEPRREVAFHAADGSPLVAELCETGFCRLLAVSANKVARVKRALTEYQHAAAPSSTLRESLAQIVSIEVCIKCGW